jgi:hypothetical protein
MRGVSMILGRSLLLLLMLLPGCSRSTQTVGVDVGKDALSRVSEKGPVRMTVRVSPPEPRLSDLVNLEIEVVAPEQIEIKAPTFGNAVGDFLVRDYHEDSSGASSEAKERTRKFRYELEPVHSGTHLIRSVVIEFVDHRDSSEEKDKVATIASDPIEVKVSTMLDDQVPDLGQLEGMLPPQPLEENQRYWWVWVVLVAIVLLLTAFKFLQRRKSPVATERKRSPEEIASESLAALLAQDLPGQGLFKDFYVRLTGLVRVYIEETTGLRAPEQTTEEFLREMRTRSTFSAERSIQLQEFLEAADMVKYAGQQPGSDQVELSIRRAQEFISGESNGLSIRE